MILRNSSICLVLLFCTSINAIGQNKYIDSLKNEYKKAKHDTIRISIYNNIGEKFQRINLDSALVYFNKALSIVNNSLELKKNNPSVVLLEADIIRLIGITHKEKGNYLDSKHYLEQALSIYKELNNEKQIAGCYRYLGISNCELSNYDSARLYLFNAIEINQKLGLDNEIAKCFSQIGNTYNYQGEYKNAINFYLKALKIYEVLKNNEGMSACYTNMGGVYYYQKNFEKAIDLYSQSLKIDESLGDKSGVSINYNNIGLAYTDLKQYKKAIDYYLKSLTICKELGEKSGVADGYNNIGLAYKELGDYNKAINYYFLSLKIAEELNDINATVATEINIADLHITLSKIPINSKENSKEKHLKLAIELGKKAILAAKRSNLIQLENYASLSLMNAYKELNNKSEAFNYAEIYIATNDSMFKKEKTEALAEMEGKYQNEKKQKEIELLVKDQTISQQKAEKQKILIISILIGLCLLVFMITFVLRRLQITRKQKRIIEEKNILLNEQNEEIASQRDLVLDQKKFIEEQNLKITDSIKYAKYIQQAVLPSDVQLNDVLEDYFILFKPKDIVSGDFYWVAQFEEYKIITVADCTGHGVPGAFMSMLGMSLLNEIVRKKETFNAAEVLNQLRIHMIEVLRQKGLQGEQKDGMDIVFCILNTTTNVLQFSGAYNPLYVITINNELRTINADRQPVSISEKMIPFTNCEIQLNKGDCIYLSSDGYRDQFGGPKQKKFMASQFTEILQKIAQQPMYEQKEILQLAFENWISSQDQLDDVTVLGVRV